MCVCVCMRARARVCVCFLAVIFWYLFILFFCGGGGGGGGWDLDTFGAQHYLYQTTSSIITTSAYGKNAGKNDDRSS